ncbi:hypothetical protein [Streptomyces sp. TLI_171]|uniref:hypothetical protein n=1 Tax=Streptomyces sp. TLI_171 TaxID=1938859 RepID=UPI000C19723B|nr:hypothetical protein [Streptomyces sp. TLI_171]RKE23323.1 hypothetical protein BX266_6787 [Streptomyces sp. TLI_171]
MRNAIDGLLRLVPAPAEPVDGHRDRSVVEDEWASELPADYRELVARYGLGEFCGEIFFCTPFGDHEHRLGWQDADRPVDLPAPAADLRPISDPPRAGRPADLGLDPGEHQAVLAHRGSGCEIDSRALGRTEPGERPWFTSCRELERLREALAPTEGRGSFRSPYERDVRQDRFAATDLDWRLTYETAYGHAIRASFPPEHRAVARVRLLAAVEAMGCEVQSVRSDRGEPVWPELSGPGG